MTSSPSKIILFPYDKAPIKHVNTGYLLSSTTEVIELEESVGCIRRLSSWKQKEKNYLDCQLCLALDTSLFHILDGNKMFLHILHHALQCSYLVFAVATWCTELLLLTDHNTLHNNFILIINMWQDIKHIVPSLNTFTGTSSNIQFARRKNTNRRKTKHKNKRR